MERLKFKLGRRGTVQYFIINELYQGEEMPDGQLKLADFLTSNESDIAKEKVKQALGITTVEDTETPEQTDNATLSSLFTPLDNKLVESCETEACETDDYEYTISRLHDGGYVELIDEETNTTFLIDVMIADEDSKIDFNTKDACTVVNNKISLDVSNNDLLLELLEGIIEDEAVIKDGYISFTEKEHLFINTNLFVAIEMLDLQDRFGADVVENIRSGKLSPLDEEFIRINDEVEDIEYDELSISKLFKRFAGKKVLLEIDRCSGITLIKVVDDFDLDRIRYKVIY